MIAPDKIWAEIDEGGNIFITSGVNKPDEYNMPFFIEYIRTDLTPPAADYVAGLEAALKSATDSRNHFKSSAASQKTRCAKLRHRQRALLSALETIRFATTLEDARFKAHIAIGGWSDDELVFAARPASPDTRVVTVGDLTRWLGVLDDPDIGRFLAMEEIRTVIGGQDRG